MELKFNIIGRVGKDAEVKTLASGQTVCSYSVATNPQKDKTVWVKVTTWGKQAETDGQYVKKGMLIKVEGTPQFDDNGKPRTYQDNSGNTVVSNFEMTGFQVKYLSRGENSVEEKPADDPFASLFTDSNDEPF